MKARDELVVGKHDIGYMSAKLISEYGDQEIAPKQVGPYQKLPRYMTDKEIEAELKPGMCDMGDVLAFLENPPEGTKDGYYNLFYTPAFVVSVRWLGAVWLVDTWGRGDGGWDVGRRVFSPATASSGTVASALGSSGPALKTEEAKITVFYRFDISNGSNASGDKIVMTLGQTKEWLERMKGALDILATTPK